MRLPAFVASSLLFFASSSVFAASYQFDGSNSLKWTAKKLAGEHQGDVKLKDGTLNLDGKSDKGRFVFDLKSINNTDLNGEWKAKLEGHLKSPDFFNVDKFPEAVFVIKEAKQDPKDKSKYEVKGDLTIKDITKPVAFPATIKEEKGKALVTAKLTINRLDWDIRYNSGKFFDPKALGDKLILDDVNFAFDLASK